MLVHSYGFNLEHTIAELLSLYLYLSPLSPCQRWLHSDDDSDSISRGSFAPLKKAAEALMLSSSQLSLIGSSFSETLGFSQ